MLTRWLSAAPLPQPLQAEEVQMHQRRHRQRRLSVTSRQPMSGVRFTQPTFWSNQAVVVLESTEVCATHMVCRVVVSLGEVELELRQHIEGQPNPLPLARFTIADLWVAFRNTQQVGMPCT